MFSQNIVWNIPSAILNVKWNKSRQEIGSKASVRLSTALTECWSSNLMTRTKPRFLKDIQSDIEFKLPVLKTESVPVFVLTPDVDKYDNEIFIFESRVCSQLIT